MKTQLLLLLTTIITINSYSQINFEKGYYIDNSNQKVDCLIKNSDWKYNPYEFEYKLTENSDKKKATIKTVKEFGIYNKFKFTRQLVNIDQSSNDLSTLSKIKTAIFKEEEVFLKVLIEGKATLYSFDDKYFYSKDGSKIEQLIFKEYLNDYSQILKNNRYKQQLWSDLKCSTINMSKVENLEYKKNELISFFIMYNECNNQVFTNFETKQKKDLFNLNIRPGFNNSSLSIQNGISSSSNVDFDNEFTFRFGIEAEFIMPVNKNKWSIIIEPTYQYYKSEKKITAYFATQNVKVDYKSIELPIGIRHYFFLNENSKIFINGLFLIDINSKSVIDYENRSDLDIKTNNNLAIGLGYKQNDKYSLEFRYHTPRSVLSNYANWTSNYNTVSVIFGYSLF